MEDKLLGFSDTKEVYYVKFVLIIVGWEEEGLPEEHYVVRELLSRVTFGDLIDQRETTFETRLHLEPSVPASLA